MCNNYYNKVLTYIYIIIYLINESEVVTGKSQTEASPYWPSDSEVNTVGRGMRFSRNDRTVKVIKLFIIWRTKIKQKSQS